MDAKGALHIDCLLKRAMIHGFSAIKTGRTEVMMSSPATPLYFLLTKHPPLGQVFVPFTHLVTLLVRSLGNRLRGTAAFKGSKEKAMKWPETG